MNRYLSLILSLIILLLGQYKGDKKIEFSYEEVEIQNLSEKHYYSLLQEKSNPTKWHEAFSIGIQQATFKTQIFSYSEIVVTNGLNSEIINLETIELLRIQNP